MSLIQIRNTAKKCLSLDIIDMMMMDFCFYTYHMNSEVGLNIVSQQDTSYDTINSEYRITVGPLFLLGMLVLWGQI